MSAGSVEVLLRLLAMEQNGKLTNIENGSINEIRNALESQKTSDLNLIRESDLETYVELYPSVDRTIWPGTWAHVECWFPKNTTKGTMWMTYKCADFLHRQGLQTDNRKIETKCGRQTIIFVANNTEEIIRLRKSKPAVRCVLLEETDLDISSNEPNNIFKNVNTITDVDIGEALNQMETIYGEPIFSKLERTVVSETNTTTTLQSTNTFSTNYRPKINDFEIPENIPVKTKRRLKLLHRDDALKIVADMQSFKKERLADFEKLLKNVPETIAKVFRKHYDTVFSGDPPGTWSALKVDPIALALRKNAPTVLTPKYRPKYTPKQTEAINEFIATNLARGVTYVSENRHQILFLI